MPAVCQWAGLFLSDFRRFPPFPGMINREKPPFSFSAVCRFARGALSAFALSKAQKTRRRARTRPREDSAMRCGDTPQNRRHCRLPLMGRHLQRAL